MIILYSVGTCLEMVYLFIVNQSFEHQKTLNALNRKIFQIFYIKILKLTSLHCCSALFSICVHSHLSFLMGVPCSIFLSMILSLTSFTFSFSKVLTIPKLPKVTLPLISIILVTDHLATRASFLQSTNLCQCSIMLSLVERMSTRLKK